jgi:hypothetical protein
MARFTDREYRLRRTIDGLREQHDVDQRHIRQLEASLERAESQLRMARKRNAAHLSERDIFAAHGVSA